MAVGEPDVIVLVDEDAVREKELAGAEGLNEIAVCVKFHDGIEFRSLAVIGAATVGDPDMASAVQRHRRTRAHHAAGWKLEEIVRLGIGIGIGVGVGIGPGPRTSERGRRQQQGGKGSKKGVMEKSRTHIFFPAWTMADPSEPKSPWREARPASVTQRDSAPRDAENRHTFVMGGVASI